MGADKGGVDAHVRAGGVATVAFDVNGDQVGGGHDRAGADGKFANWDARHVVHAVDLLDAEAVHHAVLDHLAAAAAAFLGGLEDHHGGAVEVAGLGQVLGRAQQHGGVAVMAAGVHHAVGL